MGYAFKFISGKYQGGEFPIDDGAELLIGRQNDLDLVLAEDMVSRKHAKLTHSGGALQIADLGSTNGTYVNGEKVKQAALKLNDRVLIGTSIFKIVDRKELGAGVPQDREGIRAAMVKLAERTSDTATMSGDLEEVPLPDLLQLFATNKKSGVLSVTGTHHGKIYVRQGQIQHAVVEAEGVAPIKALFRMLTWESGTFRLDSIDETLEFPQPFTESTESLLIEALRQHDEVQRLLKYLPPPATKLALCVPLTPKLAALSASELETVQLVLNHGVLGDVVDHTPGTDHEAYTNLKKLLEQGYVEAADQPPPAKLARSA